MANLVVKDATATNKYLSATGAGSDVDPHVIAHEVIQDTADDLNCNANLQVADADVGNGNPVPVSDAGGSLTVDGTVTADAGTGPWPVTDNGGSLTVDDGGAALAVDATGQGDVPVTLAGEQVDISDRAARDMGKVDIAAFDVALPAGDNNIGNVDLASEIPAGTQQIGSVVVDDIEDGAAASVMDAVNHAVKVNIVAGAAGGVSHTDDAAFTPASDDIVPAGGVYQSTPDTVDDGDAGAVRMSAARELFVQVRDAAGNDRGLNVDASGNVGINDGGNAITVDGTVTADAGTGPWPVTDNGGSLTVDDGGAALAVDATGQGDVPVTLAGEQVDISDRAARDMGKVDIAAFDVALPAGTNNIGDVDLASAIPAGTNTIGNVGMAPQTSGGYSIYRDIDLDETGISVKGSAGQVFGWFMYNLASGTRYIKLYNDSGAPTIGTDTPVLTIPLGADQGANVEYLGGIAFSSGIGIGATTGVADNDTGAPGDNEVIVNVFYT